ncbi:MAG: AMP-binding protein, partial [Hydrococcus sp. CRU_1_1]|nr:AMP-binding protein [Hydrococcus sp. CRU_1_1]
LNQPRLTAQRFIPNPFSNDAGSRLYRTGDKARYLSDGNIEFLGRIDYQVKVRGFRVELGEIEAALNQHPAIAAGVVLLQEENSGNPSLVAYATLQPEQIITATVLRNYLESKLPNYMVPNAFVILPELPLTTNGKIDRKALPAQDSSQRIAETEYIAPVTPVEEILAGIWQEILGIEKVGVRDNFFELGGDSILSLQIVAKTHQAGLHITPKQIFQHQTIAELVSVVNTAIQNSAEQGIVAGLFPLTPIQRWFFEQNFSFPNHWNQSILLETKSKIDPFLLEKAVQKLLEHHDILRLGFEEKSYGFQPYILSERTALVTQIDLSNLPLEQLKKEIVKTANDFQASFNLLTEPLIKVGLFDLGTEQSGRLLVVIHHLVVDDLSWRILLEDLQVIYQQLVQKKTIKLPLKTTSFKQWANRIQIYAQSQELHTELDYWLAMLARPVKSLPKDYPGEDNLLTDTNTIAVTLGIEDTQALLKEVPSVYRTQINDILLTALVETFAQWTGERSLLFDLEGHGREELFEDIDLSRTVGWFTSIYPVLLDLEQAIEPSAALKATKEQLRSIPQHGIGYGLLRYLIQEPKVTELLNSLPRSEICFNYLGQHDQVLAQSTFFKTALESSGNGVNLLNGRSYLFEINSAVEFGSFQIRFSYSKNYTENQQLKLWLKDF